ncbi:MAG: VOC family protein [Phycisphaerales bacterium]|nr:VOC family protein [Phycisphaerales bacterium]
MTVKPIPEGTHTLTPHLIVNGADQAIAFYKSALGAEEVMRIAAPDGKVMHAELKIGDSLLYLCDEFPQWGALSPKSIGGTPVSVHVYSADVDKLFARATAAGAEPQMPPTNMFWGDRYAKIQDPFGHSWGLATHVEDVSPEECERRMLQQFAP